MDNSPPSEVLAGTLRFLALLAALTVLDVIPRDALMHWDGKVLLLTAIAALTVMVIWALLRRRG